MSAENDDYKEKIYDVMRISMQKLEVKPGDLVVVRFPRDFSKRMHVVAEQLQKLHQELNVSVALVRDDIEFSHFTKEEMKELGWIPDPEFKFSTPVLN